MELLLGLGLTFLCGNNDTTVLGMLDHLLAAVSRVLLSLFCRRKLLKMHLENVSSSVQSFDLNKITNGFVILKRTIISCFQLSRLVMNVDPDKSTLNKALVKINLHYGLLSVRSLLSNIAITFNALQITAKVTNLCALPIFASVGPS